MYFAKLRVRDRIKILEAMNIRHKHTNQRIGGSYSYWRDNILKMHKEENYEILSKPDLVDVFEIDPNNGNKIFIETIDRHVALTTYLQVDDKFTIKDSDISRFDEMYRLKSNENLIDKNLKLTLENINENDFTILTKDTPDEEESNVNRLDKLGFLFKDAETKEYRLTEKAVKYLNNEPIITSDIPNVNITNNFHNSHVGQVNSSEKIDITKQEIFKPKKDDISKQLIIGIVVTVVGGIILYWIIGN